MLEDDAILVKIAEAARKATRFAAHCEQLAFMEDEMIQSAILYQIVLIGEFAKRLSQSFCQRHSEMPWKKMAKMRDLVVHQSEYIRLERVWTTAASDAPHLLSWIEQYLEASLETRDRAFIISDGE